MLPQAKRYTYEEFLAIDKNCEDTLEFIDGEIFNQASPSTAHQTISVNLTVELGSYFKGKTCRVFHAPYDVILKNDKEENPSKVIPDIAVICHKEGINDKNYIGVPTLIIEILSPSNEAHDLITKMNLYQRFGVKEYWIINPKIRALQIYHLNEVGMYEQFGIYKNAEQVSSAVFADLRFNLEDIFI